MGHSNRKSTQLPQYLLDDAILSGHGSEAFIVCTQPRRLSAISLAERVSEEMQAGSVFEPPPITYLVEGLKDVDDTSDSQFLHPSRRGNSLCGYEVRLKSTLSRNTRVLYCTTGILLRKLQSPEFLNKVSHIILDEVHERQVEMDFLCAVLKARLPAHPALKLILMSATLDENMISAYYASATGPCPTLHIPGRMFPVNIRYLNELPKFFTRWGSIRTRNDISPSKSDNVLSARRLASGGRQYVGLDEATESSAPVPACDSERIVELIRCIINKHFIEHPDDYDPNYKIPSDSCGEAILVFLPGLQDIRRVEMELRKAEFQYWLPCNESIASEISEEVDEDIKERRRRLRTEAAIQIHVLHSSISPEQQRRVFNRFFAAVCLVSLINFNDFECYSYQNSAWALEDNLVYQHS